MKAKRARKEKAGEKVRVQVVLNQKLVDRIDDLAERMNMTRSYFTATLLEFAVGDNEWMIKLVTSELMSPLMAVVQKLGGNNEEARQKQYAENIRKPEK